MSCRSRTRSTARRSCSCSSPVRRLHPRRGSSTSLVSWPRWWRSTRRWAPCSRCSATSSSGCACGSSPATTWWWPGSEPRGSSSPAPFGSRGSRVVVIERDEQNPLVQSCRERRIPVLAGDASDERLLARARADRARHLVATCGDDGANANVALAARLVPRRRSGALTAFVHLDDLDLWRLLGAEELGRAERADLRLEFFNVTDAAARVMLEEHPFERDAASPHILLVGLEELGRRTLLHAAARWRDASAAGEGRLRVTVLGAEAGREVDALVRSHPELSDLCEIEARAVGPAAGALEPVRTPGPPARRRASPT
ncbi:MAG: NAD-binding protein [Thermoleophilaceae bacterium]